MHSTYFNLDIAASTTTYRQVNGTDIYEFCLPLLPAFAIEYFTLQYGGLSAYPDANDKINHDVLTIQPGYTLDDIESKLVIHYHGIRDYALLFPSVTPQSLQDRLGEFYREAETSFNNGAWLSFVLMCGALFEGILYFRLGENLSFEKLITKAANQNIIDANTKNIMNLVRNYRNLVHANRHSMLYVSRKDAMDTRIVLDKLPRQSHIRANGFESAKSLIEKAHLVTSG